MSMSIPQAQTIEEASRFTAMADDCAMHLTEAIASGAVVDPGNADELQAVVTEWAASVGHPELASRLFDRVMGR